MISDKQLIKLLSDDHAEGLKEAINIYSGLLTAVVMRILKNPHEAEECVADTFIVLWKNARALRKIDSIKAYLLCIARNNAVDRYRKIKKQGLLFVDGIEGYEIIADDDVELLIVKKEFMEELQRIVMKLPEPGRSIFMRKYFLLETVKEIAADLGLNEVQVKDRLYRIRKQVRKSCEKKGVTYNEIVPKTIR
jgi:RNA polymerase sigma-70 factor (ECF subfamily)